MKGNLINTLVLRIMAIFAVVFVVVLSIGYASFNTEMSISGIVSDVRLINDIRITGLRLVENTGSTYIGNADYTADKLMFDFTLNDHFARLVYEVDVTVFGSQPLAFKSLSMESGYGLIYSIEDIEQGDKICDLNGKCTLGAKKTYKIVFENEAGDFNFVLKANYLNIYNISYEGVTGSYPTEVVGGSNLLVEFPTEYNSISILVDGVSADSSSYSYTNGILNIPSVNGNLVIKLSIRSYGDANGDGIINAQDSLVISRHINGLDILTGDNLIFADVNGDGNIDEVDLTLIREIRAGNYQAPGGKPLTDYIHYGDINEDNAVNAADYGRINAYLSNKTTFTDKEMQNADINGDGKVNSLDAELINAVCLGKYEHNIAEALTNYDHYGDINADDVVDAVDVQMLSKFIAGLDILSTTEMNYADINGDGSTNNLDLSLMRGVIAGNYTHSILSPLTNYTLYGDVNNNGVVDETDLTYLIRFYDMQNMGQTINITPGVDVNGDGKLTEKDIDGLEAYLSGVENGLPLSPCK